MSSTEFISWPKGINTNWTIAPIQNFPSSLATQCLSFICGNCFFYTKYNKKASKPSITDIVAGPQIISEPIELESLFTAALEGGTDDDHLIDYHRFQSHPSRLQSLMQCPAFARLLSLVQVAIDDRVSNYALYKCSILYSRPRGNEQGLHIDDIRTKQDIEKDGELLSVVVALQDDTKLDIANYEKTRQTYKIPVGSMFLFSGTCLHGGAKYHTANARVHLMFMKSNFVNDANRENAISLVFPCPDKDCPYNRGDRVKTVTHSQLQDHWKNVHRKKHGLTLDQFRKSMKGTPIIRCEQCGKGFVNGKSFKIHCNNTCNEMLKRK